MGLKAVQRPKINMPPPKTVFTGVKRDMRGLFDETLQTFVREGKEIATEGERQLLGLKVESQSFLQEQRTIIELDEARKMREVEKKEETARQEQLQISNQISQIISREEQKEKIEVEQTIEVAAQAAKQNKIESKIGLMRSTSFGPLIKNLVERMAKKIFQKVSESPTWFMEVFKRNSKRPRGRLLWTQDQKKVTESGVTMLQG